MSRLFSVGTSSLFAFQALSAVLERMGGGGGGNEPQASNDRIKTLKTNFALEIKSRGIRESFLPSQ